MSLKYILTMNGETMNDNNTYFVRFKGKKHGDNGAVGVELETLASFFCDRERYMSIVDAAAKNGLSFTASDGAFKNDNGGRDYCVSVYIW